jgi:hypothetical protein
MGRRSVSVWIAISVFLTAWGSGVLAQQPRVVTVQELFASNHRLEVDAGTEVVWADPHFERVWFPRGEPSVNTTKAGLATRFDTPGTYQGVFTLSGGHSAGTVYSMTVVVRSIAR